MEYAQCYFTPHTAGGSPNRQDRIVNLFCENLRRFMNGEDMLSVIDKNKDIEYVFS